MPTWRKSVLYIRIHHTILPRVYTRTASYNTEICLIMKTSRFHLLFWCEGRLSDWRCVCSVIKTFLMRCLKIFFSRSWHRRLCLSETEFGWHTHRRGWLHLAWKNGPVWILMMVSLLIRCQQCSSSSIDLDFTVQKSCSISSFHIQLLREPVFQVNWTGARDLVPYTHRSIPCFSNTASHLSMFL